MTIQVVQATQSGFCPFCSRFIAKHHSPVVKLESWTKPRSLNHYRVSFDDGKRYQHGDVHVADPASIRKSKQWCHDHCYLRFEKRMSQNTHDYPLWSSNPDPQGIISVGWRTGIQDMLADLNLATIHGTDVSEDYLREMTQAELQAEFARVTTLHNEKISRGRGKYGKAIRL